STVIIPRHCAMPHSIVYFGHYDDSFHRLHPSQDRYWNKKHPNGEGWPVERAEQAVALEFGVLQTRNDGFVIAKVGPHVLQCPVPLLSGRHGEKGIGVKPTLVDDDTAAALLLDMIALNPDLRVGLVGLLRSIGR